MAGAPRSSADRASSSPELEIGDRLAAHRAERGMKVSELARQIGVSPSLISQIERGQSRPSVSTLFSLAEALDVTVDAFFRDAENVDPAREERAPRRFKIVDDDSSAEGGGEPTPGGRYLVRSGNRAALDIEGGVRWERLTPTTLDRVEFLELVYAPGAESNSTLYRHPGTEMVLLISGRLDIFVGFEGYELEPGDSMQFPSSLPHRYVNPTEETARAVTVILHDEQGDASSPNQRRPECSSPT
jgi:transcriptional regulator with XRE-family HTH domain